MRVLLAVFLSTFAGAAAAQDAEFTMPDFGRDAGVAEPLPTPPPVLAAPEVRAPLPPAPPLRDPSWARFSLSLVGVLAGWRNFSAGLEVFAGAALGTPAITSEQRAVAGWLWLPGVELAWSKLSGPVCAGSDFCGVRLGGGVALRGGHAIGDARPDGTVRIARFLFGALSAHGMLVSVPPAPLTQGSRWGELVLRARFGVQLAAGTKTASSSASLTVHLSGFAEALVFNAVGDRFQLGVALGVAL